MEIPYINLSAQHAPIKQELLAAVESVIDSGQFILGEPVKVFEAAFAQLCGVRYAVGVNSGTDALILALKAAGVGAGDEVITQPNSFVGSATAIAVIGAIPTFVDVLPNQNMDPDKLEAVITPKTKAIMPVHLTGRPCEMDAITEIAQRHGLHIIEDCAQAVLAEYRGRQVGSFSTVGAFSLHPLKTLNACGDGGVLVTDDEQLYQELLIRRNIGLETRDKCVLWSHNTRLDTMQAAMLLVKLKYVEAWTTQRIHNAQHYRVHLADIPQVFIPDDPAYMRAVYHTFVIQAEQRDELQTFLRSKGVKTNIHYPTPIHLSPVAKDLGYQEGAFPITEAQAKKILSLPIYPELSHAQIEYVCETIRQFYRSHRG